MTLSEFSSAVEIADSVAKARGSAADFCNVSLARTERAGPTLNAFIETCGEYARRRAAFIDRQVAERRPVGPLCGVPIVIKDNICTKFSKTTCGSLTLRHFQSPYDATAIERLEAAGAIIIAKTNLDEFAMGSSTENSAFGPVRNPWNYNHVAGGSSGGSAAAVAADITPIALGSDTGGSVRQPAAFCGVVGLKPTYGRVSRHGLVSYASSLDQIGVFSRTINDAARTLAVIAGPDDRDSTSAKQAPPIESDLGESTLSEFAQSLRIGIPRQFFNENLDSDTDAAIQTVIREYQKLGAKIVKIDIPRFDLCIAAYYLIACAEASSNLARFDGVHYGHRSIEPRKNRAAAIEQLYCSSRGEGFGPEVKRRIMLGTFALSAGYADKFYNKALQVQRLLRADLDSAFRSADVILGPTAPTPAFRIGEKTENPLQMYLADLYTVIANLTGVPAVSLPCGFSRQGLPIGVQLMAPHFEEPRLLRAARAYERETAWWSARPRMQ